MRISAVVLIASLVAAACGGTTVSGKLTLFLAASLTDSFNALSAEFTKQNPGLTVTPNYAGSGALVTQIVSGADADIFASADEANMQKLVDAKLNGSDPKVFANNRLQIAVQAGNPKKITQLADLARSDVIVVIGAPSVPIGTYAQQAFDKAGIKVTPKSLETDVKQVVAKVALGEADAGIVYSTDVKAGGAKIQGVDIPDPLNVIAKYPIALVKGTKNEMAAKAFIDFVVSARGREILSSFGFILP
ncbi:MAG TPA: molybdate ABC transporter substrate-binding protein [Candidatus Acidoferrales bacterium]|nr:molybdate ABC transporter substrate-binding protein [Candidatus Acidoferrales bacterium]